MSGQPGPGGHGAGPGGHGAGPGGQGAGPGGQGAGPGGQGAGGQGAGPGGHGAGPPADLWWGVTDVQVRYGRRLALDGVSLRVRPGVVSAVVGGDGAGRTTLLRLLAGAVTADRGEVRRPGPSQIGYLSAGSGTYPDLSVMENLLFRASAYGMPAARARERAGEYLERAGLSGAAGRLAGQLSGGMRQKLGVISTMLHQPDLLVLDEPTTGVDPVSRADLWWLIARAASDGAAVLLATSYLDEAERAATVLALDAGRPLAVGTPEEIVAAMPGWLHTAAERPSGPAAARAWRRGGRWQVWEPDLARPAGGPGAPGTGGQGTGGQGTGGSREDTDGRITADMQDAVVVAALARELAAVAAPGGAGGTVPPAPPGEKPAGPGELAGPGGAAGAAGEAPGPAAAAAGAKAGAGAGAAAATTGSLARCAEVSRRFGRFTAVHEVDLELGRGEVVGLLGANGAGKTTLIRMLLGLLPVSDGQVRLFGEAPSRTTRRRIGYLPQGLGLYDDLTPVENMQFSAAVFRKAARDGTGSRSADHGGAHRGGARAGQADAVLPEPLQPFGHIPVRALPLGVQRSAAFAEALAHRPDLLILDEPTSGVDPLARARLWEDVAAAARAGTGVLVTTHYMDEAVECDRLVVMAAGRVVATGTAREITGDAEVTVVEARPWAPAFAALEGAGLPAALAGGVLRVPGAAPAQAREALGSISATISTAPATLEERFFQLTLAGEAAR